MKKYQKEPLYLVKEITIENFNFFLSFSKEKHPKIILSILELDMTFLQSPKTQRNLTLAYLDSSSIPYRGIKADIAYIYGELVPSEKFEIFIYNNHGTHITLVNKENNERITQLILNPIEEKKFLKDFRKYTKESI